MECSVTAENTAQSNSNPSPASPKAQTIREFAGGHYIKPESTAAGGYRFDFENLSIDQMIGMTETSRLPTRPSRTVLHRWVHVGAKLDDGTYLRLPTFKLHGRRYTTLDAYAWWVHRQN